MPYDNTSREEKEIVRSIYPDLAPLKKSWEWNAFEHDVKEVFIDLFEEYLRKQEREANVYGMPHLGSFELVSRHVERDGLSLLNNEDEPAMRYLFKAWKSRNPKRGLHFLRTYLQLLWPDSWEVDQQWQDKNEPYPTALSPVRYIPTATNDDASDTHYLTCRIVAAIQFKGTPEEYAKITPALRSSLGAEFLFELRTLVKFNNPFGLSNTFASQRVIDLSGNVGFAISSYKKALSLSVASTVSRIVDIEGRIDFLPELFDNRLGIANTASYTPIVNIKGGIKCPEIYYDNHLGVSNTLSYGKVVSLSGRVGIKLDPYISNITLNNSSISSSIVHLSGKSKFPPVRTYENKFSMLSGSFTANSVVNATVRFVPGIKTNSICLSSASTVTRNVNINDVIDNKFDFVNRTNYSTISVSGALETHSILDLNRVIENELNIPDYCSLSNAVSINRVINLKSKIGVSELNLNGSLAAESAVSFGKDISLDAQIEFGGLDFSNTGKTSNVLSINSNIDMNARFIMRINMNKVVVQDASSNSNVVTIRAKFREQ